MLFYRNTSIIAVKQNKRKKYNLLIKVNKIFSAQNFYLIDDYYNTLFSKNCKHGFVNYCYTAIILRQITLRHIFVFF